VTKGTKQIGKTLTNLADSPDKRVRIRAEKRLAKIQTPQFYDRSARKGNVKDIAPTSNENSMGLDTGKFPLEKLLSWPYIPIFS
jgi:hypothetical protein